MTQKIKLKICGMHCTSCAMNIDGELEDTDGVKRSSTNYAKQESEVEFDQNKINQRQIIDIVKQVGYEAILINN